MFRGYAFVTVNGVNRHPGPVYLESVVDVQQFVYEHAGTAPEIRITDGSDELVMHIVDGIVIFPKPEDHPQGLWPKPYNSNEEGFSIERPRQRFIPFGPL